MKILIGISGRTASGKTSLTGGLERELAAPTRRFSEILAEFATAVGLPTDKTTLQTVSTTLRNRFGEDILARGVKEWVKKQQDEYVIVEGIRREIDTVSLEEAAKESGRAWKLLFVDAPLEIRFARYNDRLIEKNEPPITGEEFYMLEHQECEHELPLIEKQAHMHIDAGTSSVTEVAREAVEFIKKSGPSQT